MDLEAARKSSNAWLSKSLFAGKSRDEIESLKSTMALVLGSPYKELWSPEVEPATISTTDHIGDLEGEE